MWLPQPIRGLAADPARPRLESITRAIQATDKDAKVTIDLVQHLVMVEPTEADAQELNDASTEAGCTPVRATPVAAEPVETGSGCGCRG